MEITQGNERGRQGEREGPLGKMKHPPCFLFMFRSGLNWNPIGPVVSKVLLDPTEHLSIFRAGWKYLEVII